MGTLLVVIILGALAFLGYRMYASKKKAQQVTEPPRPARHIPYEKPLDFTDGGMDPSHDLMRLQPGDTLLYDVELEFGQKIVIEVLTCSQEGSLAWLSARLDDNTWISIEPGARAEVTRWVTVERDEVKDFPGPESLWLEHGGVTYGRNDWGGRATYVSAGQTDLPPSGTLQFAEYRSPKRPDGTHHFFSYEQYDDEDFTLSKGESMIPSALQRNPGSDASI